MGSLACFLDSPIHKGREILFLNVLKIRTVSIDDLDDETWDVGGDEI